MRSGVKEVEPRAAGLHERCPSQEVCMTKYPPCHTPFKGDCSVPRPHSPSRSVWTMGPCSWWTEQSGIRGNLTTQSGLPGNLATNDTEGKDEMGQTRLSHLGTWTGKHGKTWQKNGGKEVTVRRSPEIWACSSLFKGLKREIKVASRMTWSKLRWSSSCVNREL